MRIFRFLLKIEEFDLSKVAFVLQLFGFDLQKIQFNRVRNPCSTESIVILLSDFPFERFFPIALYYCILNKKKKRKKNKILSRHVYLLSQNISIDVTYTNKFNKIFSIEFRFILCMIIKIILHRNASKKE